MPSPKARDLTTNFKARGHRRFEQHACNVETLTWSVSNGCPSVRVGPNRFRHALLASLDPREQVQILERAQPKSAANQPAMTLVDDEFHSGPTAVCSTRQVNRSPVFCEPLVALPTIWLANMNNTIPQLSSVLRRSYAKRLRHTTRDEPRCGRCSRDVLGNVCGTTAAEPVWSLKPWLAQTTRAPQVRSLTKYRIRCETSEACKRRVCRV